MILNYFGFKFCIKHISNNRRAPVVCRSWTVLFMHRKAPGWTWNSIPFESTFSIK